MRSQTSAGAKSLTRTYNKPNRTVARMVKGGDDRRSPKLETHKKIRQASKSNITSGGFRNTPYATVLYKR